MTLFSIVARLPVTKIAASSSENRNPEPVMRNPRSVTSSAVIVTTLPFSVAADLRAGLADQRERLVDHDRSRVNAGLDANGLVRRGCVDALLKRRSSGVEVRQNVIARIRGAHACRALVRRSAETNFLPNARCSVEISILGKVREGRMPSPAREACAHRNSHALSFRENQPASRMSSTDTQSRYAPELGKLGSRKFAICFHADHTG